MNGTDDKLIGVWRYSQEYDTLMNSWCEQMRRGRLHYKKWYEIADEWHESAELVRSFVEWVKSHDTDALVSAVMIGESE